MRHIDRDGLDSSDRDYKAVINSLSKKEDRRRRKLHRQYDRNRIRNYIEYERRRGKLRFKP